MRGAAFVFVALLLGGCTSQTASLDDDNGGRCTIGLAIFGIHSFARRTKRETRFAKYLSREPPDRRQD
jgi:hypothetical protein